jgi:hypothetical protein
VVTAIDGWAEDAPGEVAATVMLAFTGVEYVSATAAVCGL